MAPFTQLIKRPNQNGIFNFAILVAAIAAGFTLGKSDLSLDMAHHLVFPIWIGSAFLLAEAILGPEKARPGVICFLVCSVIFFLVDPICFIGRSPPPARAIPILLLTPVVIGIVSFHSKRRWQAWIGSLFVFFGAVFALTYNITQGGYSGISLIHGTWVRL